MSEMASPWLTVAEAAAYSKPVSDSLRVKYKRVGCAPRALVAAGN
jgi:hypothetical protein